MENKISEFQVWTWYGHGMRSQNSGYPQVSHWSCGAFIYSYDWDCNHDSVTHGLPHYI